MKLRLDLIDVDKDDPFVNCKLNRRLIGKNLKDFVIESDGGFVLSVNNKWGAGKTTFIKMWAQLMVKSGFRTLYLNAWENDFYDDPLIPLLGEMEKDLHGEKFDNLIEKAAKIGAASLPAVIKAIAKKLGVTDEILDIVHDTAEGVSDIFKEEIQNFTKKKDSLIKFRNNLKEVVQENCGGKKLIIIIDELDRCRPDYAVDLLEKIKHLFSVDNIVFILCIDKEQLGFAIQGRYGSANIDTEEYLRKFINFEYTLPSPEPKLYFKYLSSRFCKDLMTDDKYTRFLNLCDLPTIQIMTLRQLESAFFIFSNCLKLDSMAIDREQEVYLFLISMKILKSHEYSKVKNLKYTLNEFHDLLPKMFNINIEYMEDKNLDAFFVRLEAYLVFYYSNALKKGYNTIEPWENYSNESNTTAPKRSKIFSTDDTSRFYKTIEDLIRSRTEKSILEVINKIEAFNEIKPSYL